MPKVVDDVPAAKPPSRQRPRVPPWIQSWIQSMTVASSHRHLSARLGINIVDNIMARQHATPAACTYLACKSQATVVAHRGEDARLDQVASQLQETRRLPVHPSVQHRELSKSNHVQTSWIPQTALVLWLTKRCSRLPGMSRRERRG